MADLAIGASYPEIDAVVDRMVTRAAECILGDRRPIKHKGERDGNG
jgi:hypothetical protein